MSPVVNERRGFDLGDYVEVKDRIRVLYELYPQARIVTEEPILTTEGDGKPRIVVRARVYRDPDDPLPSTGTSWLELPGTTPYTKGSEVENAETSAVGRAIGFLGILIDKSIASRQEVQNKAGEMERKPLEPNPDGSLIGIARVGTKQTSDGELRVTPTGYRLGFRLEPREGDRGGILVEVNDALAFALAAVKDDWAGKPVTCWGTVEDRTFVIGEKKREVKFQALVLARIKTPSFLLPSETASEEASSGRPEPEVGAASDERMAVPATPVQAAPTPQQEAEMDSLFEEQGAA